MKSFMTLAAVFALSIFFAPNSAISGKCESPSDFVVKVHSTQGGQIEYELKQDHKYHKMQVIFFGKKGHVMRKNTVVTLTSTKGTFTVPEKALIAPAQLWFNFVVVDDFGCKSWGLVNEAPLVSKGNIIKIDSPSGEGTAFYIKKGN